MAGCTNNTNRRVYESDHFLVYTDSSVDAVVVALAQIVESEFSTAKSTLGVADADLPINAALPSTKLHVCSSVGGSGTNTAGSGDGTGIAMSALDGPNVGPEDRVSNYYGYRRIVRHELTHVLQGLLTGSNDNSVSSLELWFKEGMAQLVMGATSGISDTGTLFDYLTQFPNPVAQKTRTAMDAAGWTNGQIYPGFQLAVKYLVDTAPRGGAGNGLSSLKRLLQQIGGGATFAAAFSNVLSRNGVPMTVDVYAANFTAWMNVYLGNLQTRGTVAGATGITLVGLCPAEIGCDGIHGWGPARVTSNAFAIDVSELPDSIYLLWFLDSRGIGYGPQVVTVSVGRLTQATFDVSQWQQTANAVVDGGWWWNPAEPGRGYFIEQRSSRLFIAAFLYDSDGRATWFASVGSLVGSSTYSAPLFAYCCGTALFDAYQANAQTGSVGTLSLVFTDSRHATLTWPGGTIPIQRFEFASDGLSLPRGESQPENGWWWNADEPGTGWAVEVQNGRVFVAGFLYDRVGNPIWLLTTEALTNDTTYQGYLAQYASGQTLTSTYRSPVIIDSRVGLLTFQVSAPGRGVLTLPSGRQLALTRFRF